MYLNLIALFIIGSISVFAGEDFAQKILDIGGTSFRTESGVVTTTDSMVVSQGPNGAPLVATGAAAHYVLKNKIQAPKKPQTIVLSGLGALYSLGDAWMTNRHVLQGTSVETLTAAFSKKGLKLSDYKVFGFKTGDETHDVVLVVKKEDLSNVLDETIESQGGCGKEASPRYRLKKNKSINCGLVQENDRWWDHCYVALDKSGADVNATGSLRLSPDSDRFWLPLEQGRNPMAPGCSGSLVFTDQQNQGHENWKVSGIAECLVEEKKIGSGKGAGGVRVLPFSTLCESEIKEIQFKGLEQEKLQNIKPGGCVPIDGRGGGGP